MIRTNWTASPFTDGFCLDPFWDTALTWWTSNPDFTNCFQQTALVWVPCGFLWLMLPLKMYSSRGSRFRIRKWTWTSTAKLTLSVLLILLAFTDLCYSISVWATKGLGDLPDAVIVAAVVRIATFALSAFCIFLDRRRAKPSSAIMFVFWLLIATAAAVTFRSSLMHHLQNQQAPINNPQQQQFRFVMEMFYFPVVVVQFILSCWAEDFPELRQGMQKPCPEQFSSFPNRLTYWWITSLIYVGWRRALTNKDLWDLGPEDSSEVHSARLIDNWEQEMSRARLTPSAQLKWTTDLNAPQKIHSPSLTMALAKTFSRGLLISASLRLSNDLLVFIAPSLLKQLINFVEDKNQEPWKGFLYSSGMFVGSLLQVFALAHYFVISQRTGMHIRSAVVAAIYRKALRMSNAAKRSSTVGEIVNLMAVDSQRFMDLILWSAPLQIAIALYFLWNEMGLATLSGLASMLLLIPFNAFIAGRTKTLQISQMKQKDGRIKMMNEILNGMKILKLYAWEESFEQQVLDIREGELITLRKAAYLNSLSSFIMQLSPFIVALVTFTTFVMIDEANVLTATKAFVSLSLFNILRRPLALLPDVITATVQAKVSVDRVTKFLLNDELDLDSVRELPPNDPSSVIITNGNFAWERDGEKPALQNININVKEGELVAIVGQVGSGKTSLCGAMLGLMEKISGDVAVKGKIAYVTQQAWIQNMSLRDNILFGRAFDERRYDKVLEACALKQDIDMLPGGDQTEIGEKGINLSGGQKQRVSLARAVYSGADIYFLDDPLSAVDAHVGKHIFTHVIGPQGILHHKTRILVTHGIGFLPQTDAILVLSDGTVSETGSYRQLLTNNGAFAEFLRTYLTEGNHNEDEDPESAAVRNEILEEIVFKRGTSVSSGTSTLSKVRKVLRQGSNVSGMSKGMRHTDKNGILLENAEPNGVPLVPIGEPPVKGTKLVAIEKQETGKVSWSVYILFLRQMTWLVVSGIFSFYVLSNAANIGTNLWLNDWANDGKIPERANGTAWRDFRLGVYGGLGALQGVFIFLSLLTTATGQIHSSREQHEGMLKRIMRAPMAFFDTTPLGRIVNRFSKDVDYVDTVIPTNFRLWLNCFFQVVSTVIVICIGVPIFASVVVPLGMIYYVIQRFFIPTSRQLKRLESVSRSPIYSHFQESLTGSSVIVAQRQVDRFVLENERLMDVNNRSYLPSITAQRWLAVRVEFVGICAVFFAGLFAVLGRDRDWGVEPSDIGLSISYALNVTQILNMMVRVASELEANIVSVERIKEYTEVPLEADWIIPSRRAKPDWPAEGRVTFQNYQTRYRPELDLVLKGVTADIFPGEKVGIVGRTGAGKSSLTLALFRIVEAAGGSIVIDDVEIGTLGLHDVRSRLTIIPQEPVLFSGTLRLNLDPFHTYTDEDVWRALDNAHLRRFVTSLPDGLEHLVAEGGENLSVGQRQLICLARALLRKTKILILDEATAAIDLETDALIQTTIRDKFGDCTILTIAHRLNTIMDSTRIMVLDQGAVMEFAPPAQLLNDRESIFYGLAKSANLAP
ncbi:Multidrug resistance-associated protein 1 [Hypsibius exemplaris]|uniref:ABC-type glutathione-S-conjugate transporter n=1 Tax=Hypsibius exemplaris TaxID=2072580 RepID=A0A9X6N971_HYPEX|nr:Multidrug resistance-associated protein 1 [Hypsibius exemplaris]